MIELFDVCYAALKKLPCKAEDRDVKEEAKHLYETIIQVNNELGAL